MTSLQAKVESLTTTNALMKEDLSITRISNDKIQVENNHFEAIIDFFFVQAENKKLKGELEKFCKVERRSDNDANPTNSDGQNSRKEEKRMSFVQVMQIY